jgi:hypothetical protein
MLDHQLNDLAATVAGCERIKNTPIPYPYGVLVHRTVYMYCFLLPLGLVDAIGVATPSFPCSSPTPCLRWKPSRSRSPNRSAWHPTAWP